MVGDGISRPLFLHCPQQYHPVHWRPAFWYLHTLEYGPVVEQFKCQGQLQHGSTNLRTCLTNGQLTVEPIPTPPKDFFPPFLPFQ